MYKSKVNIKSKANKNIVAVINRPQKDGRYPTIIIQHGFKGSKDQKHLVAVSSALVNRGFQTIRHDSTNEPGESDLPFSSMTTSKEIRSFNDVVERVLNLTSTDKNNIGLMGFSLGAFIVASHAGKTKNIKAMVLGAGVYNVFERQSHLFGQTEIDKAQKTGFLEIFSKSLNKNLKITYDFFQDSKQHQKPFGLNNISCPILILHGDKDEVIPLWHSKKYCQNLKRCQIKVIKGADHDFTSTKKALTRMTSETVKFFSKNL